MLDELIIIVFYWKFMGGKVKDWELMMIGVLLEGVWVYSRFYHEISLVSRQALRALAESNLNFLLFESSVKGLFNYHVILVFM